MKRLAAFGLVLAFILSASVCRAGTTTWDGSTDSDWFVADNWSDGVPGDGDDVVINASADILLTNQTAILGSFTMNGGTLTYSNWMTRLRATNVVIDAGTNTLPGVFTEAEMSNRVWIVCFNDFTLNTNAVIDVFEKGFAADNGPGQSTSRGGGGYGGKGGRGQWYTTLGGTTNGATHAPVAPGSGSSVLSYGSSGGGGAVRIEATNGKVTIHGTINADGGTASHGYVGGGSGGAIYITCDTFQGSTNGLLSVNGGDVDTSHGSIGGGGGGGRIAVDYTNLGTPHAVRFSASPGWCGWIIATLDDDWSLAAEEGTVWLPDTGLLSTTLTDHLFTDCKLYIDGVDSWAVESLTVSNCSLTFAEPGFELTVTNDLLIGANGYLGMGVNSLASNVVLACGNLSLTHGGSLSVYSGQTNGIGVNYGALVNVSGDVTIGSGSWVFPYSHETDGGSVLFRMTNLTVAANGGFNAQARGYNYGHGPGTGGGDSSGGGYGGNGGHGSWYTEYAGTSYGSVNVPLEPGSGGPPASLYWVCRGGGLVRIEAAGNAAIDGTIRAGGATPGHAYIGPGSGGGIYLVCDTFGGSTSGLLSADGGTADGGTGASGGGGGGGRIAVDYTNLGNPHAVRFSTSSGWGWPDLAPDNRWWMAAENGTLHLPDTNLLSEVLTDGLFNGVRLVIDGFTSWTVDSLTVSNCSVSFEDANFQLTVNGDLNIYNGGLGIRDLTCGGNIVLTNGGSLSAYNVDCGGNLDVADGSSLSVHSAMTNGIADNYGALVDVDGDLSVASSSWIYPYSHGVDGGSPLFRMSNLQIAVNAGFNAHGRGYAFAQGPGHGPVPGAYGGGGGYGGQGGRGASVAATGGPAYGSTNAPLAPGSGGADSAYGDAYGGGVVRIEAQISVTVAGTITVNGGVPPHVYSGAGAAGSVFISSQTFKGGDTGVLSADGGSPGSSGGGGGGGRIAVWQGITPAIRDSIISGQPVPTKVTLTNEPFETYTGTLSVTNGLGWSSTPPDAAEPGSIVFLNLPPPRGTLIIIR